MELKWRWDPSGSELMLTTPGTRHRHGFIEAIETEISKWDGANTLTYEYKRIYRVHIAQTLTVDMMPCEKENFVTLRQAMRAMRETVTVLLIGRAYAT